MAKSHPHIEQPAESQLGELVAARPEAVRETYLAVHRLIVDAVPEVEASVDTVDGQIGYGARQFGYNGWGMAAVSPHSKWVNLHLMAGARLPDPDGLLLGNAAMRHIKLHSPEQVTDLAVQLRALMAAAARLHSQA